jgi:serine/threonine-protein kinase HipA
LDSDLSEDVPFQSIDAILRARRGNKLFDDLIETFAVHSGLSGVQPKVMIRGREEHAEPPEHYNVRGATHIVKLWHVDEYPDLAANEFFCLSAARTAGLWFPSSSCRDGTALVVERFDRTKTAISRFEDFCVLNGLQTDQKYSGGYEDAPIQAAARVLAPADFASAAEKLFRLFVLNCAIRNGDAHLRNFSIVYGDVNGRLNLPV